MIERGTKLPVKRQAELLELSRSNVYYVPRRLSERELALMRRMGIEASYRKPRTTLAARGAYVYPYLLGGLSIEQPNQVWSADITYLPMAHGFQYLVADFCVEALEEALRRYGPPEIFNTDQGAQFTSDEWLGTLKAAGVQISMDGKGRWIDKVFIERLWRSVKYEEVDLHAYEKGSEARAGLAKYFEFYNARRTHQSHDYRRPDYAGRPTSGVGSRR
jgi:putative transposase